MNIRTFGFAWLLLLLPAQLPAASLTDRISDVLGGDRGDEILDPEQAFRIDSRVIDAREPPLLS